jgi:hypothetical protein
MKALDLVGRRFGLLTVLRRAPKERKNPRWVCRCDCGVETIAYGGNLRHQRHKSCGCRQFKVRAEKVVVQSSGRGKSGGSGSVGQGAVGDLSHDPVNGPRHYRSSPSGVECITVVEHLTFCVGNAIKYLWRAGLKGPTVEDLKKARWYIDREISRLDGSE